MNVPIKVQSEIGPLKTVVLKRPHLEIENLVPDQLEELLFEEIPYLDQMQKEHDSFAKALTDSGAEVLYLEKLIAEALTTDALKERFLFDVLKQSNFLYGYTLQKVEEYLFGLPMADMITKVMAGVRKDELKVSEKKSLLALALDRPFYVSPMPNLYFTRDPSACIGGGISLSKMKEPARRRETLLMKYIIENHPRFKDQDIPIWLNHDYQFSIEGGDILVLNEETVAIGISARTSVAAIEHIAKNLFSKQDKINKVVAVDIPKSRAFMHLDTVFTMLDVNKFSIHPEILGKDGEIDSYILEPGDADRELNITMYTNITDCLKKVLSLDEIEFVSCGGGDIIAAPREQWSDGSNALAVAPGVIIAYDRNPVTNKILKQRGIEVIEIPSSELSRGRGGPRCMSMPVYRENF